MKILYFIFQGRKDKICIKLLYQRRALENLGCNVYFISNKKYKNYINKIINFSNRNEKILNLLSLDQIELTRYIGFNDIYNEIIKDKYNVICIKYVQTIMLFFYNFLRIEGYKNLQVILGQIRKYVEDNLIWDKQIKNFDKYLRKVKIK